VSRLFCPVQAPAHRDRAGDLSPLRDGVEDILALSAHREDKGAGLGEVPQVKEGRERMPLKRKIAYIDLSKGEVEVRPIHRDEEEVHRRKGPGCVSPLQPLSAKMRSVGA